MSQDSIAWIDSAPALLPLVPPIWIKDMARDHVENCRWRKAKGYARLYDEALIDIGSGVEGVRIISANGEVGYHHDPDFDAYGYVLVVRPAGYVLTGYRTFRTEPQPPGTLIAFRQASYLHGLFQRGIDPAVARQSTKRGLDGPALKMGRLWIGLIFDSPELLTPEQTIEHIHRRLMKMPQNRHRRVA